MGQHAILSASASKRWMNCTPSALLEKQFADEESIYAAEGTAAHALAEHKLKGMWLNDHHLPVLPCIYPEQLFNKILNPVHSYHPL